MMTLEQAKNIMQNYYANEDTSFEDDDGNIISNWVYKVGEQYIGNERYLNKDIFYFIVYLLPPDKALMDINDLTEDEQDEYGSLQGVTNDGVVFMPEI